ncbi:MAG: hypothetical protein H6648_09505 [Caldilineae bacterium]|nr:hypothetical protein [Caldilineae bacterium]
MTRVDPAPSAVLEVLYGALGGLLAGAAYVAVLGTAAVAAGHSALAGANAIGAWLVRWLQSAAPQAFDNFYADASLGGALIALLAGASFGALLAGLLLRLPEDQPLAWGGLSGLVGWALARWSILPALDPALPQLLGGRALLAAHLLSGLLLGAWLQAGRPRRG